ncbi:MAG: nitronate monooxygenase [Ferruginibacter sp.]
MGERKPPVSYSYRLYADSVHIPVIAAGGIATGRQMAAAMILGASGCSGRKSFHCQR